MAPKSITFLLRNETKGAVRYEEVDTKGRTVPMGFADIGALYIRKRLLNGQPAPTRLKVTLEDIS